MQDKWFMYVRKEIRRCINIYLVHFEFCDIEDNDIFCKLVELLIWIRQNTMLFKKKELVLNSIINLNHF